MSETIPCATCPWRTASVGGSAIPGFSIEQARALRKTVGDEDGFRPIMACHGSCETEPRYCVGYIAQEGYSNLSVRLGAADGSIPIKEIWDACEDLDLYPDFNSMLSALEEAEHG